MFESVRALLEGLIDYAGLFPPAGLGMAEAVFEYQRYLSGEHAWMLGRFIVPVSRLSELETALVHHPQQRKWRVSALAGPSLPFDIPAVLAFNAHLRDAVIDSLEVKAVSPDAIEPAASAVPQGFTTYFEIPADPDPGPLLEAVAAGRCRAKIRTGGIEEHRVPSVEHVARFIRLCDRAKVPFKATAGLHHPVRGVHALNYEPDSPSCRMHGFLNLLLAAAFLSTGIAEEAHRPLPAAPNESGTQRTWPPAARELARFGLCASSSDEMHVLLGDSDPAFRFSDEKVEYGLHSVSTEQIRNARSRLFISFGSCSFEEPVNDLKARGLL
jgi:hypothetical protein